MKTVQGEVKTFSSVLQNEIKTQSAAVQKNVSSVVSVKKVGDAVKLVVEKEQRAKNVVFYGVNEAQDQPLEPRVQEILNHLGQKPRIVECCRLGKVRDGDTRPIRVTFSSSSIASEVLGNSKQLKNAEGCQRIFICPDRTIEQRRTHRELVIKLRQKRTEDPGAIYGIRGGQVVKYKSSVP